MTPARGELFKDAADEVMTRNRDAMAKAGALAVEFAEGEIPTFCIDIGNSSLTWAPRRTE